MVQSLHKNEAIWDGVGRILGGPGGNRTPVQGFAVLCITTLPPGHKNLGGASSMERSQSQFILLLMYDFVKVEE